VPAAGFDHECLNRKLAPGEIHYGSFPRMASRCPKGWLIDLTVSHHRPTPGALLLVRIFLFGDSRESNIAMMVELLGPAPFSAMHLSFEAGETRQGHTGAPLAGELIIANRSNPLVVEKRQSYK